MPLIFKPADGFSEDSSAQVYAELSGAWRDYVKDCQEGDTRATLVDFAVWMLQMGGFRDGLAFAVDDCDDPQEGGDNAT
jgi:hypothetical protein